MQGSWIWHCINYLTITLLAGHWKQVWVFSWQYNPYFRISGLIWSFEGLIMRRNIYVCVYIGIYIVESIFLPFSVGGIAFVLSAVRFLGAAGLCELGAVFCQQHRHRLQFSGFSGISWETCGWVGCQCSTRKKWSVCPAGLALPAPSQCWGRGERNTFSPPRARPPTCLPLWGRKAWNTHIDLSISLPLSVWEEMPHLPPSVLLLCEGEALFPATCPMHIQISEKKEKWSASHLTARSCLPEQDKTLVRVF